MSANYERIIELGAMPQCHDIKEAIRESFPSPVDEIGVKKYVVAALRDGGYSTIVSNLDEVEKELREMLGESDEWTEKAIKEARETLTEQSDPPRHWHVDFEDGEVEVMEITHFGNTFCALASSLGVEGEGWVKVEDRLPETKGPYGLLLWDLSPFGANYDVDACEFYDNLGEKVEMIDIKFWTALPPAPVKHDGEGQK